MATVSNSSETQSVDKQSTAKVESENDQLKKDIIQLKKRFRNSIARNTGLLRCAAALLKRQQREIDRLKLQLEYCRKPKQNVANLSAAPIVAQSASTPGVTNVPVAAQSKPVHLADKNQNKVLKHVATQRREGTEFERRFREKTPEGFWDVEIPKSPDAQPRTRDGRRKRAVSSSGNLDKLGPKTSRRK